MKRSIVLSYFEKGSGRRYVSMSIKGLAERLGVHRNSVLIWLGEKGFYEDNACVVFSIPAEELIRGKPRNRFPVGLKPKEPAIEGVGAKNTKKQQERLKEAKRLVIEEADPFPETKEPVALKKQPSLSDYYRPINKKK